MLARSQVETISFTNGFPLFIPTFIEKAQRDDIGVTTAPALLF
jgi:hypothetical protein